MGMKILPVCPFSRYLAVLVLAFAAKGALFAQESDQLRS